MWTRRRVLGAAVALALTACGEPQEQVRAREQEAEAIGRMPGVLSHRLVSGQDEFSPVWWRLEVTVDPSASGSRLDALQAALESWQSHPDRSWTARLGTLGASHRTLLLAPLAAVRVLGTVPGAGVVQFISTAEHPDEGIDVLEADAVTGTDPFAVAMEVLRRAADLGWRPERRLLVVADEHHEVGAHSVAVSVEHLPAATGRQALQACQRGLPTPGRRAIDVALTSGGATWRGSGKVRYADAAAMARARARLGREPQLTAVQLALG